MFVVQDILTPPSEESFTAFSRLMSMVSDSSRPTDA